jgi:hypothetical protein
MAADVGARAAGPASASLRHPIVVLVRFPGAHGPDEEAMPMRAAIAKRNITAEDRTIL